MPARHDNLFGRIATFEGLRKAAQRAIRGKRRKPGAAAFQFGLERELLRLERELNDRSYRPGRYIEIQLTKPVPRLVSAAPFRDRVVHHALIDVVGPIFEAGFIGASFANRIGKGTHKAVAAYEHYRDRYAHVLRCDIYRYFPSIDHAVLKRDFRRRIVCERTLWLMDRIVDFSNRQEPVHLHFPGDDLLSPLERRRGLPIGNLTSQFAANVYLDPLDHFCTEVLRAPYVRYVDDFALFADDAEVLAEWRVRIADFLAGKSLPFSPERGRRWRAAPDEGAGCRKSRSVGAALNSARRPLIRLARVARDPPSPPRGGEGRRLRLHPRKTHIASTRAAAEFLGFVLHRYGKRALPAANVQAFRGRLKGMVAAARAGTLLWTDAARQMDSWAAHADHAHTRALKRAILGRAAKAFAAGT